jgi:hypothetical protein
MRPRQQQQAQVISIRLPLSGKPAIRFIDSAAKGIVKKRTSQVTFWQARL